MNETYLKMTGNVLALSIIFASPTVVVAQLVRALDCGSRGRGFEPRLPPLLKPSHIARVFNFTTHHFLSPSKVNYG